MTAEFLNDIECLALLRDYLTPAIKDHSKYEYKIIDKIDHFHLIDFFKLMHIESELMLLENYLQNDKLYHRDKNKWIMPSEKE